MDKDELENILINLSTPKEKDLERDFVIGCSKQGVLEYKKALYRLLHYSEEKIDKLILKDSMELKEGYYSISTKNGIQYHGNKL